MRNWRESCLRSACVVYELICKPDILGCWICKVTWTMIVLTPEETKYESSRGKVVYGPRLNVVELDNLEAAHAKFTRKGREDSYRITKAC
jgi:hypothetical protein